MFLVYKIAIMMKYLLAFPLLVALRRAVYKASYTDIHWLCKRAYIILAVLFLSHVLKSANKQIDFFILLLRDNLYFQNAFQPKGRITG